MHRVFPAWHRRFKEDTLLRKKCRELYHGLGTTPSGKVLTHAVLNCDNIDHDGDSFDADEPSYDLTLSIFTKSRTPALCAEIMALFQTRFDDSDIQSGEFETVICRLVGARGPILDEGIFIGEMSWVHQISFPVKDPFVRMGAN